MNRRLFLIIVEDAENGSYSFQPCLPKDTVKRLGSQVVTGLSRHCHAASFGGMLELPMAGALRRNFVPAILLNDANSLSNFCGHELILTCSSGVTSACVVMRTSRLPDSDAHTFRLTYRADGVMLTLPPTAAPQINLGPG